MRPLPVLATLVVAVAVAIMLALGVWQLQRAEEKAALLARYQRAVSISTPVPWPRTAREAQQALYRRSSLECREVRAITERAGRSAAGEMGWAHVATCALPGGGTADVALGWSRDPAAPARWRGGRVDGIIGPQGRGIRLVAAPPQAGLAPLATPNPADMPDNHLSYAVQWFLFALTAVVIYLLALRRRWRTRRA